MYSLIASIVPSWVSQLAIFECLPCLGTGSFPDRIYSTSCLKIHFITHVPHPPAIAMVSAKAFHDFWVSKLAVGSLLSSVNFHCLSAFNCNFTNKYSWVFQSSCKLVCCIDLGPGRDLTIRLSLFKADSRISSFIILSGPARRGQLR